ncbi:hypothetical protein JA1_001859 [Spathaspora sp. JA1]|nr:hypothetical protein JA1_001859 [Spathaspora sp. JA1]
MTMLGSTRQVLCNGSRRFVRFNSNKPTDDDFFASIFKRVEAVSAKAEEIKRQAKLKPQFKQKSSEGSGEGDMRPRFNNGPRFKQYPEEGERPKYIKRDNTNQEFAPQFAKRGGDRPQFARGDRTQFSRGDRPQVNSDKEGQPSQRRSPASQSGFRARSGIKTARRITDSQEKSTLFPKIVSKEVHPQSLKPTINAETFFYGKVASSNATVTSRLASVAKLQLIKSKYPFKLPKNVIESAPRPLPAQFPNEKLSRFILQNNWKLDVRPGKLALAVRRAVKGEVDQVSVGKAVGKDVQFTKSMIEKNASLAFKQKQLLFDAVNGVISPRSLLTKASWNQKGAAKSS